MPWVKLNYDRLLLAVAAFVLVVCAILLFMQAHDFSSVFASLREQVVHSTSIPAVNVDSINEEGKKLAGPDVWKPRFVQERRVPLFVSAPYIEKTEIDPSGETKTTLVDPLDGNVNNVIHPPVPNQWLLDNKQELLSASVLQEDTDGDGFNAYDEYIGKTDPMEKNSHPPYITKLFLKEFRRIPFRLLFAARNGETILLNTLDIDAPTQFLKKGDAVKGTRFKVADLKILSAKVEGITKDTSVVTLVNLDTKETIDLPKEQEVDSPTTYVAMIYAWNNTPFNLKKGQEFTLKPEDAVKYRCVNFNATEVTVVRVDDNKEIKLGKQPKLP